MNKDELSLAVYVLNYNIKHYYPIKFQCSAVFLIQQINSWWILFFLLDKFSVPFIIINKYTLQTKNTSQSYIKRVCRRKEKNGFKVQLLTFSVSIILIGKDEDFRISSFEIPLMVESMHPSSSQKFICLHVFWKKSQNITSNNSEKSSTNQNLV